MKKLIAIDIFCGIGGLTQGLIQAGIPVVAGFDNDETCKYAFENNNKSVFIKKDVNKISGNEIKNIYSDEDVKILVGCPPCQPFSKHTQKNKERENDEKWRLLYSFGRIVEDVQPHIISIENVPGLINSEVFSDFKRKLENLKYCVFFTVINCAEYGVPQSRKRLVLLASKFGDITIIPPTHCQEKYKTVEETIGSMETLYAGQISTKDSLHRACKLNSINLMRIKESRPGGNWLDWEKELRCPCHRKYTGKSYHSVYGRMEWKSLAPTITTQFYNYGTGRFGHPQQDRAISLREGALLQTFPIEYDFIDPKTDFSIRKIGRHIGNAVPVRLGFVIGKSILSHLKEHM